MKALHLITLILLVGGSMPTASAQMIGFKNAIELGLSKEALTLLERIAINQVESFQNHCNYICNSSLSRSAREHEIKTTLELFVDEKRTIQVSSLNKSTRTRNIKSYLEGLIALPYKSISIESADFHLSKKFKRSATMNKLHPGEEWLEGTVSLIQHFEGHSKEFSYIDDVKREITVYIRQYEYYRGGEKMVTWVSRIGNIQVYQLY